MTDPAYEEVQEMYAELLHHTQISPANLVAMLVIASEIRRLSNAIEILTEDLKNYD
jgi:hypothetical protein